MGFVRACKGDDPARVLGLASGHRLAKLFDRRAARPLTTAERAELDVLVLDYSRSARARELRRHADEHGLSLRQAQAQVREQVAAIVERERLLYPAATVPHSTH
jgi:hypothetical protein